MNIVTEGLSGAAMPVIIRGFKTAVEGRRIVKIGYVNRDGAAWPVLLLDNGSYIVAQRDDEGNGPGVLLWKEDDEDGCIEEMLCQTSI